MSGSQEPLANLTDVKRYKATEKYEILEPHFKQGVTLRSLARDHQIPYRTLQAWKERYKKEGLNGLARKQRSDKSARQVPEDLRKVIEGIALAKPHRTATAIHGMIKDIAEFHNWSVPEPQTIRRIIDDIDPGMRTLALEGEKVYKDKFDLLAHRDSIRPNEIWQADHRLLPIWLDNNGKPDLAWLTAIEDDYSRMIPGYFLGFDGTSSDHTALAMRQAILRKTDPRWIICGYPDIFYSDQGRDFKSEHIRQVLLHVESEHIFSEAGEPRGRGKMERFFRSVDQLFLMKMDNYCPNGEPPTAPLLTLPQFEAQFREWLIGDYNLRKHGTTKQSPAKRWAADGFIPRMPDDSVDLDLLLLTIEKPRIVQQEGIHFEGHTYTDLTLVSYVRESVTIRYDPRDIAELRVYYRGKFLCRAICPELAGETISLKELRKARGKRLKELKEAIRERREAAEAALRRRRFEPSADESAEALPEVIDDEPELRGYLHE